MAAFRSFLLLQLLSCLVLSRLMLVRSSTWRRLIVLTQSRRLSTVHYYFYYYSAAHFNHHQNHHDSTSRASRRSFVQLFVNLDRKERLTLNRRVARKRDLTTFHFTPLFLHHFFTWFISFPSVFSLRGSPDSSGQSPSIFLHTHMWSTCSSVRFSCTSTLQLFVRPHHAYPDLLDRTSRDIDTILFSSCNPNPTALVLN